MRMLLSNIPGILSLLFLFGSCTKEPELPLIDFTFENNPEAPALVSFSNFSENADNYFWDFGDGGYAREENPSHSYRLPGFYTVVLKAYNSEGSNKKEKKLRVRGTIYRIENGCSFTIYGVIGFHLSGNTISELYHFGSVASGNFSVFAFTEYSEITLGCQIDDERYFIFSTPFIIDKDTHNILEINEYMGGYIVDSDIFNPNQSE